MKEFSEEKKKEILNILMQKKIRWECPACDCDLLTIAGAYFNQTGSKCLYIALSNLGNHHFPSIMLICENCGYMRHHAIGVLGLLDEFST